MSAHNIHRGVSLYSYQEEYYHGKMKLEDCVREVAATGAEGIEVISEMMLPGFPNYSDEFYKNWHKLMGAYGTTPVCHDMFLDTWLYRNRKLTDAECVESIKKDIKHANRLGCKVIRIICTTPPEILAQCASYAEEHDVKLLLEVHAPFHFGHEWILHHYEVYQKTGSKALGFMPDFGMMCKKFPRIIWERNIRDGATEKLVRYMNEVYDIHEGLEALPETVKRMGGNQVDLAMANAMSLGLFRWTEPKEILPFMDYIHHFHGKFYEMLEDGTEYSIPYGEIIPVLIEAGFNGYIDSEYEGNRSIHDVFEVDSVEQVRRHQKMLQGLLGR